MKTPAVVTADVARRLTARWAEHETGLDQAFPHAFPLGRVSSEDLRIDYRPILEQTLIWQEWSAQHNAPLTLASRRARGGTTQAVPTHVWVESINQAALVVGDAWPARLERTRFRLPILHERGLRGERLSKALRALDGYSPLDFEIAGQVADWFLADPSRAESRLTPRQVPIPGVHAKWLQNHRDGVLILTGLTDLGLLPPHASRIHFTYLDPAHRSAGGRLQDSATVGDPMRPEYPVRVVIISENKDTAIGFPEVPGGVAIEGDGKGGRTPAAIDWVRSAEHIVYWGDMDADGFEILAGYREAFGRDIDSLLMGPESYERFERFGTNSDKYGAILTARVARALPDLRLGERVVYGRLVAPGTRTHRRVEQERIPLEAAFGALTDLIGETGNDPRKRVMPI